VDEKTGQVIRSLIDSIKCSVCGHAYSEPDATVLARKGDSWFVSVMCSHCGTRNLVAAVLKEISGAPPATDLTPAETAAFTRSPAVSPNDVLNIHYSLEEFDGDFKKLFGTP
jgi:ribosomal protein S27E